MQTAVITFNEPKKGVVSDSWLLTIREGPDISTPMIEILHFADEVELLGKCDKYYKVKTKKGRIGYAHMLHIKEVST